jgi:tetratricopeptide (TPR) repeat protein
MAVAIAERMDTSHNIAEELADLRARAWAELGNAHRVVDDLPASEDALARALDLSGHGSGDPLLLARLMDLTASLYTDQRRFDEARRLLDGVHAIYLNMGDTHSAARALISKGYSLGVALESEAAVDLLRQGILLADAGREPKLIFVAVQNLLWFLFDCGQIAEVAKLLPQVREFYPVYAEGSVGSRAEWLEGRVAASLGEDERAEKILLQVREGFRIGERSYDTALVSLDLAAVWLRHGRTAEIKELVDETVTTFRALNIQREVIGALLMLREALRKNRATAALLQTVARELRRLERLPARRG